MNATERRELAQAVLALEVLEGQLATMAEGNRPVPALSSHGGAVAGRMVRPGRLRDLRAGLRGKGAVSGAYAVGLALLKSERPESLDKSGRAGLVLSFEEQRPGMAWEVYAMAGEYPRH